ncbi:MAG: ATP phosphoribosyltransferase regulatory subunit, partial [Nitrospiria bacterium]
YKFVDRSNGRVMILRPDVTPQIARMVALLMADHPKPIRLCYSANVFRYEEEHAGREREILQIGAELIGPQDVEADAEVIALVVEVLKQLGLAHFRIAIGQIGFFKGLLQEMGVPEREHLQIQKAVAGRDAARLVQILEGLAFGKKQVQKIVGLLELFGKEDVFDRARRLAKFSLTPSGVGGYGAQASLDALARLQEIYRLLKKYGLSDKLLVDLSEVRGFGYYSGMVFEVFAEGVGYELGGGGRYDHLISQFGEDLPSTGFALHVDRLQQALNYPHKSASGGDRSAVPALAADILLIDCAGNSGEGIRLCQMLRQKGLSVIRRVTRRENIGADLEQSRRLKVAHAILLEPIHWPNPPKADRRPVKGAKDLDGVQAAWINCETGVKRKVKMGQLLKLADELSSGRHLA